jgi:phage tail sheath protein FI
MSFPTSPGVNISEIDLTTIIPSVATTSACIAGLFRWGPVMQRFLVDQELTLASTFLSPTNINAETFFAAASFLAYSNALYVTRVINANDTFSALATTNTAPVSNVAVSIQNQDDYNAKISNSGFTANSQVLYIAKYPGAAGNSLFVSVCDSANAFSQNVYAAANSLGVLISSLSVTFNVGSNSATFTSTANSANLLNTFISNNDILNVGNATLGYQDLIITGTSISGNNFVVNFANPYILSTNMIANSTTVANGSSNITRYWRYYRTINKVPGTTPYVASRGGSGDEMHAVVIDQDGVFTNVPGQILEVFPSMSRATDGQNTTGQTNYYVNIFNNNSQYVWWGNDRLANYSNTSTKITGINTVPLYLAFNAGSDGASTEANVDLGVLASGYGLYSSPEDVQIDLIISGKPLGGVGNTQNLNYIINNICESRKDCMVFGSPDPSFVINNKGYESSDIIGAANNITASTYAFMDSGYKYVYDKYNNVYRYVPLNGDIAGLVVATEKSRDAWWSPAGLNRGIVKNVIKLPYNPKQADRDLLYAAGVNPVIAIPGSGPAVLYGDKTFINYQSAFSRINVRRLFIVLERAISTAAKRLLFEFNDEFTRAQFVNMVEPYLRDVQGRRGIYDFKVVCDETNNTPQVIDNDQFVGDIYIKPSRSINFMQLNFVAIATGVSFNEIVGQFG